MILCFVGCCLTNELFGLVMRCYDYFIVFAGGGFVLVDLLELLKFAHID